MHAPRGKHSTTPPPALLLRAALTYAGRGWPVHPLHNLTPAGTCTCKAGADCPTPGKHPRLAGWQRERVTGELMIRRWWRDFPHANVGGRVGDGLAVLDVDPRGGGDETLRELERQHGALPLTPTVLTGRGDGGCHYWFRYSGRVPGTTLGPGLELKADARDEGSGMNVVLPPSFAHMGGRRYEWDAAAHPADIPLAPLPAWVRELAREKTNEGKNPPGWFAEWLNTPLAAGSRRGPDGLPKGAGYLLAHGVDLEAAIRILIDWDARNRPPLGAAEVERHVRAIFGRYEAGSWNEMIWDRPPAQPATPKRRRKARPGVRIIGGEVVVA